MSQYNYVSTWEPGSSCAHQPINLSVRVAIDLSLFQLLRNASKILHVARLFNSSASYDMFHFPQTIFNMVIHTPPNLVQSQSNYHAEDAWHDVMMCTVVQT